MLIAFDFDGTLSDSEMTVLLAQEHGVADDVAAITERAMGGELEYAESLRERAALLEGLPAADAARAYDGVRLRDGAAEVVTALREAGHTVAILTGGFETGIEVALERADVAVDVIVANRLPTTGEGPPDPDSASGSHPPALSGEVEGPLVGGTKDDALAELAAGRELSLDETVAVGDGANDLPMLQVAGTAVGYDPTPAVQQAEPDHVVHDMRELRDLFVQHGFLDGAAD
jgi:phosphoserine phosphatase